jgi:fatty-acyl-CoA synthase
MTDTKVSIFDQDLPQTPANHAPFSPLSFIERTAEVYPHRLAIVHGDLRQDWATTYRRCRQLASALTQAGIGKNDTVAVMLPNTPPMVEAHYGVPLTRAVLNSINTRLDAATVAFILQHSDSKVVLVDREFSGVMAEALAIVASAGGRRPTVIDVDDVLYDGPGQAVGDMGYEALLAEGDPAYAGSLPEDEWDAIGLNYTSGTTGNPKGVVVHHRGAYMNAVANAMAWALPRHPVYLWTLPLFHCNGWCFPWTLAAVAGTHVCLRKVDPKLIFELIREHRVTHYCGAPIVHSTLIAAPEELRRGIDHEVQCMVAGAAPPAAMIAGMQTLGFKLTHVYGLTEVYGPAAVCMPHEDWAELPVGDQVDRHGRQGVRYQLQQGLTVMDPQTMSEVPRDGETMGEVMFRGNIVMKGYLKNEQATSEAFRDGWFHTGDLGVLHPDGYVKLKDRAKDIIISGGENISSIEVEDALYRHPAVMACAVVAKPDPKWGETPLAFVELRPGTQATEAELIEHCRGLLARFKCPREVRFAEVPKTSTGKIQKHLLRAQVKSDSAIVG